MKDIDVFTNEQEIAIKLIPLDDFLRCPSIFSNELQLDSNGNSSADDQQQQINSLIYPKDSLFFVDENDRNKLHLLPKSTNLFSRHLLITNSNALQTFVSSLINSNQWIIYCKLKYFKLYSKDQPIRGDVLLSLNVRNPLIRYEILRGLDLFQQSLNEKKSSYLFFDFSSLLIRWFKFHLRRSDQYPSLSQRILYRYQIQTSKCSLSFGFKSPHPIHFSHRLNKNHFFQLFHKSPSPTEISIDFSSFPTFIYSIQLDNLFLYAINEQTKDPLRNVGHRISFISVTNLKEIQKKCSPIEMKPTEMVIKQPTEYEEEEEKVLDSSSIPLNDQEKSLFDQILKNRLLIEMQHEQLLIKASQLIHSSLPSLDKDLLQKNFFQDQHFIR